MDKLDRTFIFGGIILAICGLVLNMIPLIFIGALLVFAPFMLPRENKED